MRYNRIPNGYEVRRDGVLIGRAEQVAGSYGAYVAVTLDGRRFGPFVTLSLAAERLDHEATEQK